jgi:glycosyltransferase involved in cell wall biosynthesis
VRTDPPVTVLQSFADPRPTTNPYVVMLADSLRALPEVRLLTFSWRRALWARYDVFHAHWPEILVAGRGPQALARQALFLLLLLRLRLRSIPLVRTVHNLKPQEALPWRPRALLALAYRWTGLAIRLNEQTPVRPGLPAVTIVHGHYRDWFAGRPRRTALPGRLAFVGLIRPYKNAEGLIRAFRDADDATASLLVAGNPLTTELAAGVRDAADGDPRVLLRLAHLDDDELVTAVSEAEVVVLPYREMHNSGAALLALSLDRPVLAPANEVNDGLAAEVGAGWVLRYDGEITGPRLMSALEESRRLPPGSRPDLDRRGWDRVGLDHLAAYRLALGRRYSE